MRSWPPSLERAGVDRICRGTLPGRWTEESSSWWVCNTACWDPALPWWQLKTRTTKKKRHSNLDFGVEALYYSYGVMCWRSREHTRKCRPERLGRIADLWLTINEACTFLPSPAQEGQTITQDLKSHWFIWAANEFYSVICLHSILTQWWHTTFEYVTYACRMLWIQKVGHVQLHCAD